MVLYSLALRYLTYYRLSGLLLATLAGLYFKLMEQQNSLLMEINAKSYKIPEICEGGF